MQPPVRACALWNVLPETLRKRPKCTNTLAALWALLSTTRVPTVKPDHRNCGVSQAARSFSTTWPRLPNLPKLAAGHNADTVSIAVFTMRVDVICALNDASATASAAIVSLRGG